MFVAAKPSIVMSSPSVSRKISAALLVPSNSAVTPVVPEFELMTFSNSVRSALSVTDATILTAEPPPLRVNEVVEVGSPPPGSAPLHAHREVRVAVHEGGEGALRFLLDLDALETLQGLLPEDA